VQDSAPHTNNDSRNASTKAGPNQGERFRKPIGEVTRVDGPYAEGKEVVGGWSLREYASLEEAVADQRLFAELHAKHWPEVPVVSTLPQASEGPEAPGD